MAFAELSKVYAKFSAESFHNYGTLLNLASVRARQDLLGSTLLTGPVDKENKINT